MWQYEGYILQSVPRVRHSQHQWQYNRLREGKFMCENILASRDKRGTSMVASSCSLPPVCRAFAIISRHLSLMESEVTGARGNVLINVLGATSVASLLWLELLLELLWDQSKTTAWTSSIHTTHTLGAAYSCMVTWMEWSGHTFPLSLLDFPVMGIRQALFVLSSCHLKVCLHCQAHLEHRENHTFSENE